MIEGLPTGTGVESEWFGLCRITVSAIMIDHSPSFIGTAVKSRSFNLQWSPAWNVRHAHTPLEGQNLLSCCHPLASIELTHVNRFVRFCKYGLNPLFGMG